MRDWRVWLGLAVSAASIWLVVRQVDLPQVVHHMGQANIGLMLLLIVSVPATLWMKAVRWRLFFRPDDPVSVPGLFAAMFIGYMVIVIVPLRAGEMVRAFLAAQGGRVSFSRVLATIVVEKVLDVLVVAVLLLGLTRLLALPEALVWGAQAGGALVIISVVGLGALSLAEKPFLRLLARVERLLPILRKLELGRFLVSFNQGLEFVRSPRAVALVSLWTVAIWLAAAVPIWAALEGTGATATAESVALVLSVTNLGMVIPSGPGYLGTYHALVTESLKVFGVDTSLAFGTALLLHALSFGTVLVGGLYLLWHGQYGLSSLLRSSKSGSSGQEAAVQHASVGAPASSLSAPAPTASSSTREGQA